jgi:hypothetical protein
LLVALPRTLPTTPWDDMAVEIPEKKKKKRKKEKKKRHYMI